MATNVDLGNFYSAWTGVVDAVKTWDPSDPVSTQGLVANLQSFSASITPLITENPTVNEISSAVGVQAANNALSFVSAGFGYVGSAFASTIAGNSEDEQIGSAVGGAIGGLLAKDLGISQQVGSLVGARGIVF